MSENVIIQCLSNVKKYVKKSLGFCGNKHCRDEHVHRRRVCGMARRAYESLWTFTECSFTLPSVPKIFRCLVSKMNCFGMISSLLVRGRRKKCPYSCPIAMIWNVSERISDFFMTNNF